MIALNAETPLNDLFEADPSAIERLAGFHANFAQLRDPQARRSMAKLIRIADVARIAELPLETVLAAARGEIGAATGQPPGCAGPDRPVTPPCGTADPNDWFALAEREGGTVRLDVRPMLARGEEPFAAIMTAATGIPAHGFLLLDAPFDPAPLRRVLAGKGFVSQGRKLAERHWRLCFRRTDAGPAVPQPRRSGERWQDADGVHIDVRGLEPPQPMTLILDLIDAGQIKALTVHHEREPLFLYPELADRGWACLSLEERGGEVILKLARQD
jgi:hypothetical protein